MNITQGKLQFTTPQVPEGDELALVKAQVIKALTHIEKNDESASGVVELVATALSSRELIAKQVLVDLSLKFTVGTEVYPYLEELTDEDAYVEDLLVKMLPSPEQLTKVVAEAIHNALSTPHKQHGDVTLQVDLVYDYESALAEAYEEAAADEIPADWPMSQQQVPMTYRPSGLPTILDADSDPFNRVLGMEFTIEEHSFKAAFTNSHGTVIHLYEKVGRKWRPLCDRANAKGPNGISIQSNRDHRTWCTQCEAKYANKQAD